MSKKPAPVSPAVASIDHKIATITARIADLHAQLKDLEAQREKALQLDNLKVGAEVLYKPARSPNEEFIAKVIYIQDEGNKGTWYTLRLNEGTADEMTRKARLAEITLR